MAMQYIQTGGDTDGYWIEVPDNAAPETTTSHIGSGAMANPAPFSPWEIASNKNSGFNYTPQQLGWDESEAKRFADAGITKLPQWFNKQMVTSGEFHLGSNDPIANYIDLATTPYDQATSQWQAAKDTYGRLTGSAGAADPNSDAFKEAYVRDAFGQLNNAKDGWMDRNSGWMMSGASIAWPASFAAGAALGGGAAAEGAAGVGGGTSLSSEASMSIADMMAADAAAAGGGSLSGIGGLTEYGLSNSAMIPAETVDAGYLGTAGLGTGWGDIGGAGATLGVGGATGEAGAAALGAGGVGLGGYLSNIGSWLGTGNNAMTAVGLGSSVLGGLLGYNAQQNSIDAAKDTSKDSIAFQKYMYDTAVNNYEPYRQLGLSNLSALNSADVTGGSGKYISELESLGKNFTFDANDPAYTQKMKLATEANDKALASRGMYNSRAGLNLQDETTRNIQASEYDKQYNRKYGALSDLFNMTNKNAATDYSKLLDMVKIGSGAASSAGSAATNLGSSVASTYGQLANNELQSGQSTASLFSGLGAQPLNYLLLQSLLNKN